MNPDDIVYTTTNHSESMRQPFVSKELLYVLDSNGGSYSGNQINIDTSAFSNSSKWVDYSQAYLAIPYTIGFQSSVDISAAANNYAFTACLKSGFWQILDSVQVDFNGTTIIQQTPFINQFITFKVLSTWSENDQVKYGTALGFWKDDATSFTYAVGATASGNGVANNRSFGAFNEVTGNAYQGSAYNNGMLQRLQALGYTSTGSVFSSFNNTPALTGQANYSVIPNGGGANQIYYYSLVAKIRLKDISNFFEEAPLLRGAFMRFQINFNSAAFVISVATGATTMAITSTANLSVSGRTNPIMVSSGAVDNPLFETIATLAANAAGGTLSFSSTVGQLSFAGVNLSNNILSNGVRLYAPVYTMKPEYEQEYLTLHPTKTIEYYDVWGNQQYGTGPGSSFSFLVSNGLKNMKFLVVVPHLNSVTGNNANVAFSELQSPFSTAPATTAPQAALQQFQVMVAGRNVFANQIQYDFDVFLDEVVKTGLNSGYTTGLCSGLLGEADWRAGYRYYLVDLSRSSSADEFLPKSLQIQGINGSLKNLDLYVWVAIGKSITIDSSTSDITQSKL